MKSIKFKNIKYFVSIFSILIILTAAAIAAPGNLDPTFNASVSDGRGGVYETTTQPDGKIIAVGSFIKFNGVRQGRIARFYADGTLDASFNNGGSGADNEINAVALQADGKIIIGGNFTAYNGQQINRLARLNADGSLDTSFVHGLTFASAVLEVAVQADGKVLGGGAFNGSFGPPRGRIVRLTTNGTLDSTFSIETTGGADNTVRKIIPLPDGKILLGGDFTSFSSSGATRIARLNNDGSVDTTFAAGLGFNNRVTNIIVQSDGKYLVGGWFSSFNGTATEAIIRLNTDGTIDMTYDITPGNIRIDSLELQSDGKIVISFDGDDGNTQLIRLNSNGTIDSSFTVGNVGLSLIYDIKQQANGKLLISGTFVSYNNQTHYRLLQINSDGAIDAAFNPSASVLGIVYSVKQQPDGKIIVGGDFDRVNGVKKPVIARLNNDGSLDNTFNVPLLIENGIVYTVAIQPDGKILIGGFFYAYSAVNYYHLLRLNPDGSPDTSFTLTTNDHFTVIQVNAMALQADGKIVIGGYFLDDTVASTQLGSIRRLNTDGTLDGSFIPQQQPLGNTVKSVLVQSDNKILIGGTFNGLRPGTIRYNPNGTFDTTYSNSIYSVYSLVQAADGKILAGGSFNVPSGNLSYSNIVRLNSNGSIDNSFNSGSGANDGVRAIKLQADGKILIGGFFTSYNGNVANRVARLNADGSYDSTFNTGAGASGVVFALESQNDNKVLVGGQFLDFNGTEHPGLVRLQSAASSRTQFDFDGDGKADISVFRPSTGTWYLQQSQNGFTGAAFGQNGDKIVPADYDGDGKTDLAAFRGGTWYLNRSSLGFTGIGFGLADDIPAPADYDGDGKADLAVFRPSTGVWYLLQSTAGFTGLSFGTNGDKPVAADYDGDGKADLAVFRAGTWYIQRSQLGFTGFGFGLASDMAVPADYDGDGKADAAVFRPSTGTWYLNRSTQGFTGIGFGQSGDLPTAADYDGDGKADIAVFRAGTWYLNRTTAGFTGVGFGLGSDLPVPNAYVR